jgi:transcriptional regulator with XRE-family HTH domain
LTPETFRRLRAEAGLSLRDLAQRLRMRGTHAVAHLREMESGDRSIPGPTSVALEALAAGFEPAE